MMASLYEPLFRHVLFPAYESGLRRRKTLAYLREYQRQQWLDPEQIDALQWRKLQALLRHCWDHVPYYRRPGRRWASPRPRTSATARISRACPCWTSPPSGQTSTA